MNDKNDKWKENFAQSTYRVHCLTADEIHIHNIQVSTVRTLSSVS